MENKLVQVTTLKINMVDKNRKLGFITLLKKDQFLNRSQTSLQFELANKRSGLRRRLYQYNEDDFLFKLFSNNTFISNHGEVFFTGHLLLTYKFMCIHAVEQLAINQN